jgi:hypothetical protein
MVTWLELEALNQYRLLLEQNLGRLIEERGDLVSDPTKGDDTQDLRAWLLQGPIDDLVVQAFRRSFVLCLWAAFESCVVTVADELAKLDDRGSSNLGEREFLKAAKQHFKRRFGIEIVPDADRSESLHKLDRIRKALVHGLGTKGAVPPKKWTQLESDARATAGLDTSRNFLYLEADYLDRVFEDVRHVLIPLIEEARDRIEAGSKADGDSGSNGLPASP